jgi:hypothetical protein
MGPIRPSFDRQWMSALLTALLAILAGSEALAVSPPPSPCGTNGPMVMTMLSQPSYSYVQDAIGDVMVSFSVNSPAVKTTGGCDTGLPYVFGNGNGADPYQLPVSISIGTVTDVTGGGSTVLTPGPTLTAILAAFGSPQFTPMMFNLAPPGTGTQMVDFTFTNSSSIPPGDYDIEIVATPENGVGVGAPSPRIFAVTVTEPVLVDTLDPLVTIVAPEPAERVCLNGDLSVNFTAIDPLEGGAGTGITAVSAVIDSVGTAISDDISGMLMVSPALPVLADVLVTATADVAMGNIGSFILTASASDDAGHQGESTVNFSVAVDVSPLPPISVPGRQFKAGSTVPIKWKLTDCDGMLLPPFASVVVEIHDSGGLLETRYAGDGAGNIRWDVDEFGNATQYITNFEVPAAGAYTVKVFVEDADGGSAEQGSFGFLGAANKGGKI